MNATWLHRHGRPRALVFFAGWGMDATPFRRLAADRWDVLVCWDYRRLDIAPCMADLATYPELALVAWSLGCAAGHCVARARNWKVSTAVAVNGTLVPEDGEVGIESRWLDATARHLTAAGWEKFVRRMCGDAAGLAAFDEARPIRDLPGAVEELHALRRLPPPENCVFRTAIVSERDRIIPPDNQRRGWQRVGVAVRSLDAPHYPFHLWTSWDEVLACST